MDREPSRTAMTHPEYELPPWVRKHIDTHAELIGDLDARHEMTCQHVAELIDAQNNVEQMILSLQQRVSELEKRLASN